MVIIVKERPFMHFSRSVNAKAWNITSIFQALYCTIPNKLCNLCMWWFLQYFDMLNKPRTSIYQSTICILGHLALNACCLLCKLHCNSEQGRTVNNHYRISSITGKNSNPFITGFPCSWPLSSVKFDYKVLNHQLEEYSP